MSEDLKTGGAAAASADKGAAGADAGKAAGAGAGTIADAGVKDGAAAGAGQADKGPADTGAVDKGGAVQQDWRDRYAGQDAEALKRLSRFTDEAAFFKSYRALEGRLSSGELKKALPEGATPEEVTAWRKENGIPENEAGYVEKLALPNGVVLGEADKPIVAEFAKAALASNIDPKAFNGLVAQYYTILDQQRAKQESDDATFKQQSEDALRAAWKGADFRANLTAVQNLMAGWPEGLATRVLAGRSADGRKLGDDPAFVQQLAALARELNPAATLVPAGTSDPVKGVAAELESIRALRRNDPAKYEQDRKKYEAREIELIDAELKMKSRAA